MFRLPEGWSEPEIIEDEIVADGLAIRRAGISTSNDGEEAFGSAASLDESPLPRAELELLERAAVVEAVRGGAFAEGFPVSPEPDRWRFAKTNGVAIHRSRAEACERALWELAERDRLLRSWYGDLKPREIAPVRIDAPSFEWHTYSFVDECIDGFSAGIEVCGVFGFPRRSDLPFAYGFGARPTIDDAAAAATREALQMLAFLWGEPLPEKHATTAPNAMAHLDAYQASGRHAVVRRWVEGAHARYGRPSSRVSATVDYLDLTPRWAPAGLVVVKALSKAAELLAFGNSPFVAHLPPELQTHPIP